MKNLIMMIVVVTLFAINTMQAERTLNPVAYYENGNISWNVSENDLKYDFENAFNITISDMEFSYYPDANKYSYLFITGTDNSPQNNNIEIAIRVFGESSSSGNGDDIFFEDQNGIFKKNSCTGDGCSSCAFTRGGWFNLSITGCECNSGSGNCNHSIEERDWVTVIITVGGLFK